jgi:hypothetical protein
MYFTSLFFSFPRFHAAAGNTCNVGEVHEAAFVRRIRAGVGPFVRAGYRLLD